MQISTFNISETIWDVVMIFSTHGQLLLGMLQKKFEAKKLSASYISRPLKKAILAILPNIVCIIAGKWKS